MARKATVDRNIVLQSLKEGKTSQSIASQFGVSRQAIDLYRKEFVRTGLLSEAKRTGAEKAEQEVPAEKHSIAAPQNLSLDQMIELLIKAFSALKRLPELESEAAKYRCDYEKLLQQIEQLEQAEKKRKEQENRWAILQHHDTTTGKPDS
ncbi:MAG: hypothetical protein JW856_03015 [Dehalococcoidales bacterium]|nr:hypothetical protein [Dehalococcoidales bacterium]